MNTINPLSKPRSRPFDLYGFSVWLKRHLAWRGVEFTRSGYAVIRQEWCLADTGRIDAMYPLHKASQASAPKRTVLCPFEPDEMLIAHLRFLHDRIAAWRNFAAVGGYDLSVCANSDPDEQRFMMQLNGMLSAFFALEGIRIVPNFRMGGFETLPALAAMPRGVPFAVGGLGSVHGKVALSDWTFRTRLLLLSPAEILVYGAFDKRKKEMSVEAGVPFRAFPDYRTACFAKAGRAA